MIARRCGSTGVWAALHATIGRLLLIDEGHLLPYAQLRSMGYVVERIGDGMVVEEP